MDFAHTYLAETMVILSSINRSTIEEIVEELVQVRNLEGRLFILGVGGSAAHASHAVNDFRKLCAIEAYCPTDNVAEFSARVNDDGLKYAFRDWLINSNLNTNDAVMVISVGGGSDKVSTWIEPALQLAREEHASLIGIVGRDGGRVAELVDIIVNIAPLYKERITPHTEGITSVILHLLVSHPELQVSKTTW